MHVCEKKAQRQDKETSMVVLPYTQCLKEVQDLKFKASMGYIVRLWHIQKPKPKPKPMTTKPRLKMQLSTVMLP